MVQGETAPNPSGFPFRAVLSDVDGTLLDANREVSARTGAAIRALCASGVPFALVTGRMPGGIEAIRRALGVPLPAVCLSGALVVDAENRPLASRTLSAAEASFVMGLVADSFPQLATSYFAGLDWFVGDASHPAVRREASIVRARPEKADLAGVLSAGRLPNKLFFTCADDPGRSLDLVARIKADCPGLNVIRSTNGVMVEVLPAASTRRPAHRTCSGPLGSNAATPSSSATTRTTSPCCVRRGAGSPWGTPPRAPGTPPTTWLLRLQRTASRGTSKGCCRRSDRRGWKTARQEGRGRRRAGGGPARGTATRGKPRAR